MSISKAVSQSLFKCSTNCSSLSSSCWLKSSFSLTAARWAALRHTLIACTATASLACFCSTSRTIVELPVEARLAKRWHRKSSCTRKATSRCAQHMLAAAWIHPEATSKGEELSLRKVRRLRTRLQCPNGARSGCTQPIPLPTCLLSDEHPHNHTMLKVFHRHHATYLHSGMNLGIGL